MKLRLGKGEAADKGIARIMRELCVQAHRTADTGDTLTDNMVFELRKTVKMLRAILRIARQALAQDTFRKLDRLLRDSGRELGRPRDSAVLLETLDGLLDHFRPLPDEVALQPARNALHCRYQLALEDILLVNDEHPLATRFRVIEQHFRELDLQRISDPMLLEGIRKSYRRCRKGLRNLHAHPSTENSHELRRQVKYAWNQLRLLRKRNPRSLKPVIAGLDRLGRRLGQDCDLAMLVDALQRHPEIGCSRLRTEFIIALAESRRIALLASSLQLADQLFAAPPKRFGVWLEGTAGSRHH